MKLLPKQQKIFDAVLKNCENTQITIIRGPSGSGKSVILEELAKALNNKVLTIKDVLDAAMDFHPFKWEEALYSIFVRVFKKEFIVLIDDIDLIYKMNSLPGSFRHGVPEAIFESIKNLLFLFNRKMITTVTDDLPPSFAETACIAKLPPLETGDLEIILRYNIDITKQIELDVERVIKYAPGLSSHQVAMIAKMFSKESIIKTKDVIDVIDKFCISSVLPTNKPESLREDSLIGLDYAISLLTHKVLNPIEFELNPSEQYSFNENYDYSQESDNQKSNNPSDKSDGEQKKKKKKQQKEEEADFILIKKSFPLHKGILLHGPEGSGKTALGKVLAGKLPDRFVFLDTDSVLSAQAVLEKIKSLFNIAKRIAPSIFFLDDLDVYLDKTSKSFFPELANYLKVLLDGVQKNISLPISVILTTSKLKNLPEYLLRSGRFDLHIELKLPDEAMRQKLFKKEFDAEKISVDETTLNHLAEETEMFTYMDCKRLVREVVEEKTILHQDKEQDLVDLISKKVVLIKDHNLH